MVKHPPVAPAKLLKCCAEDGLDFDTTDDLQDLVGTVGQARALEALRVGLGIRREGYNIFVLGTPGVGKHTVVREMLKTRAKTEPKPSDWCYVFNFTDDHQPLALEMPAGTATGLRAAMKELIDDLQQILPATFASDTFGADVRKITEEAEAVQEQALEAIETMATERHIAFERDEDGFTFRPLREDGEGAFDDEAYASLPDTKRDEYESSLLEMQERLNVVIGSMPRLQKEARDRFDALERDVTRAEVERLIEPLEDDFSEMPRVLEFLSAVKSDIVEQRHLFQEMDPGEQPQQIRPMGPQHPVNLRRYEVNVLCDHCKIEGAPIVLEDNPALNRLIGRIEHRSEFGALVTDHTLIKPGAFHLANGGYLIIDARKTLMEPHVWSELKRILRAKKIRMDSPGARTSLMTTVSLAPEAIPLDVKVVLLGDPGIYYELSAIDPDFERYFKIVAAFEETIPRTRENTRSFARMIATKARTEKLRPFDREAVARIIEHTARQVEDSEKLSANLSQLFNLMDEADYWAGEAGREVVGASDVEEALSAWVRRMSQSRDNLQQALDRGTLMVDTSGKTVGQINGLAVVAMGNFEFGRPSRITATASLGKGELVDIDRESQLAGSIHSKGVLILSSLLASRYAQDTPLSLSASLVFEQSYGMIDGDSASLAELCALLSAIAEVPIDQSIAVTGSINQQGFVQAIGGVNAKIEGFYDLCQRRGLTGSQGVIIPVANVKNLMLHRDVVAAAREHRFHVWAVETFEEAVELLTGMPAGKRDTSGKFPEGSLNARVEARLAELLAQRRQYAASVRQLAGDV